MDAEVKLTEEKALTIDEAIEESRANQKLVDMMNETSVSKLHICKFLHLKVALK